MGKRSAYMGGGGLPTGGWVCLQGGLPIGERESVQPPSHGTDIQ